jgi:hypothetical protein
VPSVEPSSTTMISIGWVLRASDSRVLAMHSFSLYAGTITLTGRVTGGPQLNRRLLRRRWWRRARITIIPKRPITATPTIASPTESTGSVHSATATAATSALPS